IIIPDPNPKRIEGGYYETRCLLKAELENGITVLVTHFGLNPDEQENAVKTVLKHIKNEKCILMGDFNIEPDNELLLPIKAKMKDTSAGFCENKKSFPSDNPRIKIDYIFVSNDIEVVSSDIADIIASDHRPHIAEVNV
ncbi:MAG: endonuclease/exonuclease/phosphatase family protein, partial [Clostridia bacterium]|nr:endonuclease/exonuclease/phosphatase family protein [Clostridia bacterium]